MEGEEGPARRNTRAALAEIPIRLGEMRVSPEPLTPINLNTGNGLLVNGFGDTPRHAFMNGHHNHITPTSSAFLSPTPSPDEMVIQQRGRRRIPVTWSPDIDYRNHSSAFQSNIRTPPRASLNLQSPSKNGITLRSTPRKRLLMTDLDKPSSSTEVTELNDATPQKYKNQSPTKTPAPKRLKIERLQIDNVKEPLEVLMRAMSHDQLINIIKGVVQTCPQLEEEIRDNLPLPDLKPVEEKLMYLKSNIFRSIPTSRLFSKTDSPAYSRASTHMLAFKKYLKEQGKILVDSHNWRSVLDYAIMAWSYVRGTPLWDNHPHNAVRRYCFKYLAELCMSALKKYEFDQEMLSVVQEKFERMITDSDDIRSCLNFVNVIFKSAPQSINNNSIPLGRRGM